MKRLLVAVLACELTVVALEVARTRKRPPALPQDWHCSDHPDVGLHPAGGGFCFKCAQARKGVSA